MDFGTRLAALRKQYRMTQQTLADTADCHVTMIRRYEANETQPTLEDIRKMSRTLSVSADTLVFDAGERGPSVGLRVQFEALSQFSAEERRGAPTVIDGLILKHTAHHFATAEAR